MVYCAIVGCTSRTQSKEQKLKSQKEDPSFFKVPKVRTNECEKTKELSERRRAQWVARINRPGIPADPDKYRVCSRHFLSGSPSNLFDECNPDWAPSLNLGYAAKPASEGRYHRQQKRHAHHQQLPTSEAGAVDSVPVAPECVSPDARDNGEDAVFSVETGTSCQTELTSVYITQLEDEVASLRQELREVKESLAATRFTQESLRENNDKVAFYTGLPSYLMVLSVFNILKDHVAHTSRNALSQFEEVMLFFIRMRLGSPMQDLAYRFDVSQATASRVCEKWLDVFYDRLGALVRWPEKEEVMKTMPVAFAENFDLKVRAILDCFEVFIQRPSSLVTRSETWSHYKHHNTVKFLLAICPQGMVTFISKAFGGRASDKHITEDSGVLQLLDKGDIVLADRGFLIAESVGMCCATLAIPAFTKGKKQLSSSEVERTREIANVRIHVERVIGMVRNKYTVLKGCLPVEFLNRGDSGVCSIDKIAKVCCALTNLCNSVVPLE